MPRTGRPKKTPSILPEGWKEDIIEIYKQGDSDVEIRCWIMDHEIEFSDKIWARWVLEGGQLFDIDEVSADDEELIEFYRTIKMGKTYSQKWWNKKGKDNLKNKDFSAALWYMNMKNRFQWKDKQEEEVPSVEVTIVEGIVRNKS